MSLKAFHIVFILAAISICTYFGVWVLADNSLDYGWMGWASLGLAVCLTAYLFWFCMKLRKLKT